MKITVNKPRLNFIIDIFMFVDLAAIAGIGFMMKYSLLPGFKRNEVYGRNVELYFMGLDRHEWGGIHLILSYVLLGLLLLHIIFHWKMITGIFRRMFLVGRWRPVLASLFLAGCLALALLPMTVEPDVEPLTTGRAFGHGGGQGHGGDQGQRGDQGQEEKMAGAHGNVEVYGYMTLKDVSDQFGLSCTELAASINVPAGDSLVRLGRLRQKHGFNLSDLRDYISEQSVSPARD